MKKRVSLILLSLLFVCLAAFSVGCSDDPVDSTGSAKPDSDKTSVEGPSASESVTVTKFTVRFDLCTELDTTAVLPMTVEKGSTIERPEVYVNGENDDNWQILGWYTEKTYETEWDFDMDEVEADITLYAKWKSDPQRTVSFFAGDAETPTYVTKVKKGLTTAECSERFNGYEVLGYYTAPDFGTEFDFTTAIEENTNIYVKLSDYIYFTPRYLSTFKTHNATATLAEDGKSVDVAYAQKDNFLYVTDLDYALNGHELIEIVYKLKDASRVDIYWLARNAAGEPIEGLVSWDKILCNVGLAAHGAQITTDSEGWTHIVYDLSHPRGLIDKKLTAPLTDIATLNCFRIDVDGETADPATLTIKYVKGMKKADCAVDFYANGAVKKTVNVMTYDKVAQPADKDIVTGRKVLGYYTTENFAEGSEFDFNTAITGATKLYAKLSDYVYFDGAMLNDFTANPSATKTLNDDGTLTMKGNGGSFIHMKNLGLAMNGTNTIEIKAKVNVNGGRVDIFAFGKYTLDGAAAESTDYGKPNTFFRGLTTQGWTVTEADENGYVIMRYNLAYTENGKAAKDMAFDVLNGFRIDFAGGNETNEITIEYVKSIKSI